MNSGLSSGPHGGDDSTDREKNALYVSFDIEMIYCTSKFYLSLFYGCQRALRCQLFQLIESRVCSLT